MDGSTLLQLRTDLRRVLNEPFAGFWQNSDLNAYIRRACEKYYSIYQAKVPEFGRISYSVSYPASSTSVTVTETDWSFREALALEDITSADPGELIQLTNSISDIYRANSGIGDGTTTPLIAYVGHDQTVSFGVVSNTLKLWIAPKPSSSLSLRLIVRALPRDISGGDMYTTGLPAIFDMAIVLQAAVYARLQEQNSDVAALNNELARAEQFLFSQIRPYAREATQVLFESDD